MNKYSFPHHYQAIAYLYFRSGFEGLVYPQPMQGRLMMSEVMRRIPKPPERIDGKCQHSVVLLLFWQQFYRIREEVWCYPT